MTAKKSKIVYTDPATSREFVVEVYDLEEGKITEIIGHDDWDYVVSDVPVTQAASSQRGIAALAFVIALLPLLILPVSAEWRSQWKTAWVNVENGHYEVPYFPGKRKIYGHCYFIHLGALHSEAPDEESGECHEG